MKTVGVFCQIGNCLKSPKHSIYYIQYSWLGDPGSSACSGFPLSAAQRAPVHALHVYVKRGWILNSRVKSGVFTFCLLVIFGPEH